MIELMTVGIKLRSPFGGGWRQLHGRTPVQVLDDFKYFAWTSLEVQDREYTGRDKFVMSQDTWGYLLKHYPRESLTTRFGGPMGGRWNSFICQLRKLGLHWFRLRTKRKAAILPEEKYVKIFRDNMRKDQTIPICGHRYSVEIQ